MKAIEEIHILCPYCNKICKIIIGACCNQHKYLYEEQQIEKAKIEGRYRYGKF
jgi:hypothetical protein